MTRVIVTSLVRRAGLDEPSGFATVLDLEARTVLARTAVPGSAYRVVDPNPRGGVRGAKGVSAFGDRLVVANSERLFVLRGDWSLERELTHPWAGGIHDVLAGEDGIRVACTNSDLLLHLSWRGEVLDRWSWRSTPELLGFDRAPPFDEGLDFRDPRVLHTGVHNVVHLNAVTEAPGGLLLSLGRILPPAEIRARERRGRAARRLGPRAIGAVRRARAGLLRVRGTTADAAGDDAWSARVLLAEEGGGARVVHRAAGARVPAHNAVHHEDGLLWNDSAAGALRHGDRRVPVPGAPPFPRGLAPLAGDRVLVGGQRPAAVHVVDLAAGAVVETLPIGGLPAESVYAIAPLPEGFADPPSASKGGASCVSPSI